MRRSLFVLLTLLAFTTTAWAQVQAVVHLAPEAVLAHVSADDVVARMLSFDRNNDGKVDRSELAERQQSLVTRGDFNGDGALDRSEVHRLAVAPPLEILNRNNLGVKQFGSSYGFADQTSLSSRNHINESLDDLRLAGPAKERAAVVVSAYVDTLEATALADLLTELNTLMQPHQVSAFRAAIELSNRARVMTMDRNGERITLNLRGGPDPGSRIEGFALPPDQTRQAKAAFDLYKARLKMRDTERAELMTQLQDVLSAEERDNFRAALERRPVVENSSGGLFGTVGGLPEMVDTMRRLAVPVTPKPLAN
jgi:hypothetical protein